MILIGLVIPFVLNIPELVYQYIVSLYALMLHYKKY
jgi:hypothetical protein